MASWADRAARWRVPLHFLIAVPVLWLARPFPAALAGGAALVVVGLAIRGWAAGHLRRDLPLTVSGPYAHLRHPLYFGSAFILAGLALATGSLWLALVLVAAFVVIYVPVMRREERERQAGSGVYADYAARVPAFWPRLRAARGLLREAEAAPRRFTLQLYLRNREWRAAVGCALVLAILAAKMLWG